jgi:hypothetical protein
MSAGVDVRIVKQTFGAEDQEHVLVQFQTEGGDWVYADPSVKDKPLGWHAPANEEVMIDPLDPSAIGMVAGTPEAEFIGVGRPRGVVFPRLPGMPNFPREVELNEHGEVIPVRYVERRPLGAVAATTVDPFIKASTDLSTMNTIIAAGDSVTPGAPNYTGAVNSYQAAGNQGATVIGPEIDLAGASSVTQPITQQALSLNSTLQALNGTTSTATDAATAASLVKQMAALYAQAIDAGRATLAAGGGLTFTQKVFIALAGGAVVGAGWAYYKHSQGTPKALPAARKKPRRHPRKRLAHRRR